jgi:hypothetical protein
MDTLINERLVELTQGLLFMSESDYPFEQLVLDALCEDDTLEAYFKRHFEAAAAQGYDTLDLATFLKQSMRTYEGMTPEDLLVAARFVQLYDYLKLNAQEVQVFKTKGVQRECFILALSKDGLPLGVKTTAIET